MQVERAASSRSWWIGVSGIAGLGVAGRAIYVLVVLRHVPPGFDSVWYTLQGGSLRNGSGYVVPASLFSGQPEPTAAFPPGYPAYQALWQAAFGDGPSSVRLAGLVPAVVTIVATALVARHLAGRRAGLVAAAVVAADPMLVAVDGSSMSESLAVPLVMVAVLLTVRALDGRPAVAALVPLGVVCGVAILTRQDLALVTVALFGCVLALAADQNRRRGLLAVGLGLVVVAGIVTPWAVRNERKLGTFAVSTLSPATALAGANCDATYGGAGIGQWEFNCVSAAEEPGLTEVERASHLQKESLDYAREHVERLALVVPARVLRVWGLWDPRDQVPREVVESRSERWQQLSWVTNLAIVTLGAWGLRRLVRTDRTAYVLLVPILSVVVIAALSHGNSRFSAVAHPVLAIGIAGLLEQARGRVDRRHAVG